MGQTGRRQVDCSRVVGRQQQMSDRRQYQVVTGGHRGDWRSTISAGLGFSTADRRRLSVTQVYCDKTIEARITRFSQK